MFVVRVSNVDLSVELIVHLRKIEAQWICKNVVKSWKLISRMYCLINYTYTESVNTFEKQSSPRFIQFVIINTLSQWIIRNPPPPWHHYNLSIRFVTTPPCSSECRLRSLVIQRLHSHTATTTTITIIPNNGVIHKKREMKATLWKPYSSNILLTLKAYTYWWWVSLDRRAISSYSN